MLQKHLLLAINAAIEAGAEIMKYYSQGFEVEIKNDNTPVTEADKASNKIIESWLLKSGFPILSEEGYIPDYEERKSWDYWWIRSMEPKVLSKRMESLPSALP